jgi:sugar phosphate isomerase/epimerase
MPIVMFTKLFKGRTLDQVAADLTGLGFQGADLLIRPGHQLEPSAPEAIAPAVRLLEAAGLAVPMATTDLVDPDDPTTARVLGACADAGVRLVRLGYFRSDPATPYAAAFERARRALDGLARLAASLGVTLALQLHGRTIHASGAQAAALLRDHDARQLAAYPDPGNQATQDGREDWRFTFEVLRPWLACVGVKNGGWFPAGRNPAGQRQWRAEWLGIADGMVPWDEILPSLAAHGFQGVLTLHSHYEGMPLAQALDQTRADLAFVRRLATS